MCAGTDREGGPPEGSQAGLSWAGARRAATRRGRGVRRRGRTDEGDLVFDRGACPGRKPPKWAVKRPARPYKMDLYGKRYGTLKLLNRPGRARTARELALEGVDLRHHLRAAPAPRRERC
jgi:hypothetical protein